jgi:hypothetical protein
VNHWTKRTELSARRLLNWLGSGTSRLYDSKHRFGKANEHNACAPRDWWLEAWDEEAIVAYHDRLVEQLKGASLVLSPTDELDPSCAWSRR